MQPVWQRVSSSANVSHFSLAESLGWQRFEFSWDELLRGLLDTCLQGPLRGFQGL